MMIFCEILTQSNGADSQSSSIKCEILEFRNRLVKVAEHRAEASSQGALKT